MNSIEMTDMFIAGSNGSIHLCTDILNLHSFENEIYISLIHAIFQCLCSILIHEHISTHIRRIVISCRHCCMLIGHFLINETFSVFIDTKVWLLYHDLDLICSKPRGIRSDTDAGIRNLRISADGKSTFFTANGPYCFLTISILTAVWECLDDLSAFFIYFLEFCMYNTFFFHHFKVCADTTGSNNQSCTSDLNFLSIFIISNCSDNFSALITNDFFNRSLEIKFHAPFLQCKTHT